MDERWKTDGNCEKCRRKSYCKKPCTANKRRGNRLLRDAIRDVLQDLRKKE